MHFQMMREGIRRDACCLVTHELFALEEQELRFFLLSLFAPVLKGSKRDGVRR